MQLTSTQQVLVKLLEGASLDSGVKFPVRRLGVDVMTGRLVMGEEEMTEEEYGGRLLSQVGEGPFRVRVGRRGGLSTMQRESAACFDRDSSQCIRVPTWELRDYPLSDYQSMWDSMGREAFLAEFGG